ncbi:cytochrome c [Novosphingobium sp. LASN5T]|uniref:c-type cytochrome n=1 Tax=Novosphingobium sp. LASN5T TaxID=2491021 RepID=UPI000F5FC083|nr:cytochrome c [Novosphingobium sp. LASN5T]RQW42831.1 cytochrome c [Novosphingobium sp. LASN5T]
MNGLATVTRGGLLALLAVLSAAPAQPAEQKDPAAAAAPAARPGPPSPPPPLTLSARPNAKGGERLYVQYCGMCHGKGGMGTGLLARRTDRPLLEERNDLTVDYVIQAARTGIGNMPPIPRGEVSDADIKQIAAYLTTPKARGGR